MRQHTGKSSHQPLDYGLVGPTSRSRVQLTVVFSDLLRRVSADSNFNPWPVLLWCLKSAGWPGIAYGVFTP